MVHRNRARLFIVAVSLEKRLSSVFRVLWRGILVTILVAVAVAVQYVVLEHEKKVEEDSEQRQPNFPKVACNNHGKDESGLVLVLPNIYIRIRQYCYL